MLHYGLCAICFMKRILFYIICEKCGRDLILFFPFWPRECCASFLSDQLFIFGLPNVVLSTGFFLCFPCPDSTNNVSTAYLTHVRSPAFVLGIIKTAVCTMCEHIFMWTVKMWF